MNTLKLAMFSLCALALTNPLNGSQQFHSYDEDFDIEMEHALQASLAGQSASPGAPTFPWTKKKTEAEAKKAHAALEPGWHTSDSLAQQAQQQKKKEAFILAIQNIISLPEFCPVSNLDQFIKDSEVDINGCIMPFGETPLIAACMQVRTDLVKKLLEHPKTDPYKEITFAGHGSLDADDIIRAIRSYYQKDHFKIQLSRVIHPRVDKITELAMQAEQMDQLLKPRDIEYLAIKSALIQFLEDFSQGRVDPIIKIIYEYYGLINKPEQEEIMQIAGITIPTEGPEYDRMRAKLNVADLYIVHHKNRLPR